MKISQTKGHILDLAQQMEYDRTIFLFKFDNNEERWLTPDKIDMHNEDNARVMEHYIYKGKGLGDQQVLLEGFSGAKRSPEKEITNQNHKKNQDNREPQKNKNKQKQDIIPDCEKQENLIRNIISHKVISKNKVKGKQQQDFEIIFNIEFENNLIKNLSSNEIQFQINKNKEKLCEYIKTVENKDDYQKFCILKINGKYIILNIYMKKRLLYIGQNYGEKNILRIKENNKNRTQIQK